MGDRSAHFSDHEFVDHSTGHLLPPPAQLLELLEAVRALSGRPLRIVSGHRCCGHNAALGGAERSRHIYGDAADIPTGVVSVGQALELGAVGVGGRDGWAVHVDVRPGPPVSWRY